MVDTEYELAQETRDQFERALDNVPFETDTHVERQRGQFRFDLVIEAPGRWTLIVEFRLGELRSETVSRLADTALDTPNKSDDDTYLAVVTDEKCGLWKLGWRTEEPITYWRGRRDEKTARRLVRTIRLGEEPHRAAARDCLDVIVPVLRDVVRNDRPARDVEIPERLVGAVQERRRDRGLHSGGVHPEIVEAAVTFLLRVATFEVLAPLRVYRDVIPEITPEDPLSVPFDWTELDGVPNPPDDRDPAFVADVLRESEEGESAVGDFVEDLREDPLVGRGVEETVELYLDVAPGGQEKSLSVLHTPDELAELLARLSVDREDATVLDPACGTGAILDAAYDRKHELADRAVSHRRLVGELYGVDVSPLGHQIGYTRLLLKDRRRRTESVNLTRADFFDLHPSEGPDSSTYTDDNSDRNSAGGEEGGPFGGESFDVVLTHPPSLTPASVDSREAFREHLSRVGADNLPRRADLGVYFVTHAVEFLEDNGVIGCLLPEAIGTTEWGREFCGYLVDEFQIETVVRLGADSRLSPSDFGSYVFVLRHGTETTDPVTLLSLDTADTSGVLIDNLVDAADAPQSDTEGSIQSATVSREQFVDASTLLSLFERETATDVLERRVRDTGLRDTDVDPAAVAALVGDVVQETTPRETGEWVGQYVYDKAGESDEPGTFLVDTYGEIVVELASKPTSDLMMEWSDWLADQLETSAEHDLHDTAPSEFLSNVCGRTIEALAEEGSPDSVERWVSWLTTWADDVAVGSFHSDSPEMFLENVYSVAISRLVNSFHPAEVPEWADWLTDRIDTTAVHGNHDAEPAQFLENVYSMAISRLVDSFHPAEVSEWTDWLVGRINTAATHGTHEYDPSHFLPNVYSMAISNIADSFHPAEVSEWTDRLTYQVETTAVHGTHSTSPSVFLANVYSMTISNLTDSYDPAEVTEWTDWVYKEIQRHRSSDTHDLADDEFVADCCAMALAQVTPELPAVESAWHEEVLARSLDATPTTALARFYARYANAVTQVDVGLIWQSWIVRDCLDRTINAEQPVTDEPAELAASVVADTLFSPAANADSGLRAVPTLLDTVAAMATDDPEAFETLLNGVETRYANGNVSEWVLNDPESTDIQAVGRRVLAWVRGRAFVHALTDSDTDTLADDIHEAAVESAHEASEPDVPLARFYLVALVGLAAETDPEDAAAHDDLLGDALQHEVIDSLELCTAYFTELPNFDSYLPSHASEPDTFDWHCHLVDDLLTRAEIGASGLPDNHEETGEEIARMLAAMADGTYPASGPTDAFHTLLDTVADHDTDAPVTAHAVERVPELLDEEYTNMLAQFDWKERFE